MELYIDFDMVSAEASIAELEAAMKKIWAEHGRSDLCLQRDENGPQLILSVMPPVPTIPESFQVELVKEHSADTRFFDRREDAANAMRRFLAGRPPFAPEEPADDCPLCQVLKP